jgi:hypothetical protein
MLVVSRRAEGEVDEVAARQPRAKGSSHPLRPCQRVLRRIYGPNLGPVCASANRSITMHQAARLGQTQILTALTQTVFVCVGLLEIPLTQ